MWRACKTGQTGLEVEEKCRNIHNKLVADLLGHIYNDEKTDDFTTFKTLLSGIIKPPKELSAIENISEVFEWLEKRGKIELGKYAIIKDIVEYFNRPAYNLVIEAEMQIEKLKNHQWIRYQRFS